GGAGLLQEILGGVAALGDIPPAGSEKPPDLPHVEIAARIHRPALGGRGAPPPARSPAAPPREHPPPAALDADASPAGVTGRSVATRRLPWLPPELGDVRTPLSVEHEVRRTARVGPLGEVLAVRAEDLDAVVLAVAHEDATVGVHGDPVGEEELTRRLA